MVNDLLIEFINEEKLNALELIDALYYKETYNLSNDQINNIKEQLTYKIENSNNLVELIKIKEKLEEYNMNTSLVERFIKRQEKPTNIDIQNFDYIETQYYMDDGFDSLTIEQKILLYKKAQQLKFNQTDLDDIIEQINDEIELIDNKQELIKIKQQLKNNNINTSYIDNIINTTKSIKDNKNEQNIEYIKEESFSIFKLKTTKKENIYEDYQFEEEELEEDDFYYEDPD